MKLFLINIFLLLSFGSNASTSNELVQKNNFVHKIANIAVKQGEILSRVLERRSQDNFRLDRFDMQLGISASGDVGIVGVSGGSAVEFIWQRNDLEETPDGELPGDDIDEEEEQESNIEISLENGFTSSNKVFAHLLEQTRKFVSFKRLKKRKRRRIIKILRRDAQRISRVVASMVLMPRVGDWYVGGFFKNYSLSKDFGLGPLSIGKSTRLRFRFKVSSRPMPLVATKDLSLEQKVLRKMMIHFNRLSISSDKFTQFSLKRVFAVHTLTKSFDIGIFGISSSKGIQVEYKRLAQTPFNLEGLMVSEETEKNTKRFAPVKFINEKIIGHFDRQYHDDNEQLSLHQIRIKHSTENGIDFKIASIEKSSTIEYHYKR